MGWARADSRDRPRSLRPGTATEAATAGTAIRTGSRVDAIAQDGRGVELLVGGERIRAKAAILACGVSYRFQRLFGLGLPGQVVHTAPIEVDTEPSDTVELYFGRQVALDGFVWVVPVTRDGRSRSKIGVLARGDAGACLQKFISRPEVRWRLAVEPGAPIRRLLPLKPITRTYGDRRRRRLLVGAAGGFTKPTTGGGVFYSLLMASLAAETLIEAFAADRLDEGFLERYEQRWQARLGSEMRVGDWLRQLVTKCSNVEIDTLVRALASDDVQAVIRSTARFNWDRDLILALVRQQGIAPLLVRSLFR